MAVLDSGFWHLMSFATNTGAPPWQLTVYALNNAAFLALLVRLVSIRIVRTYPALTGWLIVNLFGAGTAWAIPMDFDAFRWLYVVGESFNLIFFSWMVFQLYTGVLESYPGIASLARRVIQVILPLSVIGSLCLLPFEVTPRGPVTLTYLVSRTLIAALALFVLMITAFMVWFPVRVHRNAMIYSIGFALFLVPKAASMFLTNSLHAAYWFGGVVTMIACTMCLLLWTVGLRRSGETTYLSPGRVFHPADEARLLAQLESVNRTLLRARTK
jgi:hypothetical protein